MEVHRAGRLPMTDRKSAGGWRRAVLCVAVAMPFVAGCEGLFYGEGLYEVQIENATPSVVVVSEVDVIPSAKPMVTRLIPGKILLSVWRRPRQGRPDERAVVRAENEAGVLVFCQRVTYADVQRLKHRITIVAGSVSC